MMVHDPDILPDFASPYGAEVFIAVCRSPETVANLSRKDAFFGRAALVSAKRGEYLTSIDFLLLGSDMRKLLSITAILMATSAFAEGETGAITITEPTMFKAFENARAAGGYLVISNSGTDDDLLLDVKIEGHMAMIHESREEDGVMRMLHVDAISIPSEGTIAFAPGVGHGLGMGREAGERPVGETGDATLVFERAGEVPVTFTVEPTK